MLGVLEKHLMGADGAHAIVDAVSLALRIAFDAEQRSGVDHGAGRPSSRGIAGHGTHDLETVLPWIAESTCHHSAFQTVLGGVVARDDPGARDGVFPQLHRLLDKHSPRRRVNATTPPPGTGNRYDSGGFRWNRG